MNTEELATSFPAEIGLPEAIRDLAAWSESKGWISGSFELKTHDDETLECWFGSTKAIGKLAQFGAGADGSLYCLWLQEDSELPVVHLGSEGDSILVLAENADEFLRLLAIGYDEVGFSDFDSPVPEDESDCINEALQAWVSNRTAQPIPQTGASITAHAAQQYPGFQDWVDSCCN